VVLEALAVGTPVIGADVGEVSRMVEHGVTGFVVAPAHIEGYCRAITEVLDLGSIARQRVRSGWPALEATYDVCRMVHCTVKVWQRCLAQAGRSSWNDSEVSGL
jgi:glycosyltransferase involved in cell wall biosynthesis